MNLFKTALLAVVCVAAASTPSLAAKGSASGWGGPYAGLSIGYLQDRGDLTDIDPNYLSCTGGCSSNPDAANTATFGAQAGYNWQEGRLVYGFEGDANLVDGETLLGYDGSDRFQAQTINASHSLRARLGLTMDNDYLIYGTAGFAMLRTTSSHQDDSEYDGADRFYGGWTGGIGVEKKIASAYSIKAEARYSDFSSKEWTDSSDEAFGADPATFALSAGVNYHF